MCLWRQLPKHPNIVPFDKIVVDEIDGNYVGFTNVLIPGETLDENKSRIFKLKWLQQLVGVIDLLNLTYGISHQDVAPRNILIDEEKDNLLIFDFTCSARIPKKNMWKAATTSRASSLQCMKSLRGIRRFGASDMTCKSFPRLKA